MSNTPDDPAAEPPGKPGEPVDPGPSVEPAAGPSAPQVPASPPPVSGSYPQPPYDQQPYGQQPYGQPPCPQQPPAYGQPYAVPPGGQKPLGAGAGAGIGCGAHVIAFFLAGSLAGLAGVWGFFLPFVLIAVAAIVMMFFPQTRKFATGVLIIVAAAWIIVLGPCFAIIGPH